MIGNGCALFLNSDVVQTYPLERRRWSMTPSGRNVFARTWAKQGRQATPLPVAVEFVRTPDGLRQRTLCYLDELNDSVQARWLKTIEVFNENSQAQQLKLFPSEVKPQVRIRKPTSQKLHENDRSSYIGQIRRRVRYRQSSSSDV